MTTTGLLITSTYLQCNRHISLRDDNNKVRWFCFPPARLPLTCRELGWNEPKRQWVQLTGAPWWHSSGMGFVCWLRLREPMFSPKELRVCFSQSRLHNEQVKKRFSSKQKQRKRRKDAFSILQVCKFKQFHLIALFVAPGNNAQFLATERNQINFLPTCLKRKEKAGLNLNKCWTFHSNSQCFCKTPDGVANTCWTNLRSPLKFLLHSVPTSATITKHWATAELRNSLSIPGFSELRLSSAALLISYRRNRKVLSEASCWATGLQRKFP